MPPASLRKLAESETPSDVDVPPTWSGLIIWAVAKFGGGIIMAGVCAYAAYIVYRDDHILVDRMMAAFEKRAEVDGQIARALADNAAVLAQIKEEIRDAHVRASGRTADAEKNGANK